MIKHWFITAGLLVCICVSFSCNEEEETKAELPQNVEQISELVEKSQADTTQIPEIEHKGVESQETVTYGGDDYADQISYGGDAVELPDGWPGFLPVYPDAKLVNAQRLNRLVGIFLSIGLETQDPLEAPVEFYEKLLLKKGYELAKSAEVEGYIKNEFYSSKRYVEIECRKEELRTMVYVNTWENPGS